MSTADELGFDRRTSDMVMIISGSYKPGDEIDYDGIYDGDSVELSFEGFRIKVDNVYLAEED